MHCKYRTSKTHWPLTLKKCEQVPSVNDSGGGWALPMHAGEGLFMKENDLNGDNSVSAQGEGVRIGPGNTVWDDDAPWIDQRDAIDESVGQSIRPGWTDLIPHLLFWKHKGFILLDNAADTVAIDGLMTELRGIAEDPHAILLSIDHEGRRTWTKAERPVAMRAPGVKIHHLHVASRHAASLTMTPAVTQFLRAILNSPVVPLQSSAYLRGAAQGSTLDYDHVTSQRRLPQLASAWIALDDWADQSPRPTSRPRGHRCTWNGRGSALDQELDAAEMLSIHHTLRKGDILVRHAALPNGVADPTGAMAAMPALVIHFTGLKDYPAAWLPSEEAARTEGFHTVDGLIFEFPWDAGKRNTKLPSWSKRGEDAGTPGYRRRLEEPAFAEMPGQLEPNRMKPFAGLRKLFGRSSSAS